jgi:phosphoglycerol geranylgeranyltransferase
MKVAEYIKERLAKHGPLHMTLIDPAKQKPARAAEIAALAESLGSDAVMVGGSTDVNQDNLDKTTLAIKQVCAIPVIYFPSGAHAITRHSDAIYFMSMLNSRNLRMVIREQVLAAPIVMKLGIEPISMGYVIVEPGMKVGEIGEAEVVKRNDTACAVAYCLAAQFMGMALVYLEAGSGAPEPVPAAMVSEVKKLVRIPLVVGGGIRDATQARELKVAGADIIVTGTVVENGGFRTRLESIIRAIKE